MTPRAVLEMVLIIAVVGVALAAALWAVRRAGAFLPLRRSRRLRFGRLVPLLEVGLAAAAVVAVAALILEARPAAFAVVAGAVAALLVAAAWFAVRDVVAGALLRAEDAYEPGQWIRVGDVEGRIRNVGTRTVDIEREDGARVRIPYTRLAGAPLIRAGRTEDASSHTFTVELPADRPPVRVLPAIRAAARNCFFVSATREPHIHVTTGAEAHRYEVTVFTLDRIFVPDIEAAVRRSLGAGASDPV